MSSYDPSPIVTLGGVNWASDIINSITITAGRASVDDQPRSSYCTINLVNYANRKPTLQLNDRVQVSVLNSAGDDPVLFDGYITDVQRTVIAAGSEGLVAGVSVTCVGPLARLARLSTKASYAKAYDGTQVEAVLADVTALEWDEVDAALIWNDIPATYNWTSIDPGYVGTIATPGDFELQTYSGGAVAADSLCTAIAKSALGVLYETPDGLINYDAASTRTDRAAAGFLTIDAGYLQSSGLNTSSRVADLVNDVTITYKNGATTHATAPVSVLQYGTFAANINTYLEQGSQAIAQRDLYLSTRSIARNNVAGITVPLHNPDLPDDVRDTLLGAYCGLPISIPNLPQQLTTLEFRGFVEGYTWVIANKTATITMNVSDYGLSAIQQAWRQVNTSETWNTVSTSLDWADAKTVA